MDATFNLELHTGDVYYALRPDQPAITLTPPFHHTSAAEAAHTHQTASASTCHIHIGTTQFLGLRGGHECSDYYVWVDLSPHSSSCERFAQQDDLQVKTAKEKLDRTSWTYSSCQAGSTKHFYTDITNREAANNLAVEVEDIEINTDPESLSVMLFKGEVGDETPVDRKY